ncbi:MAG TPA: hypothetical protein VFT45_09360, partial [Longimicrobium sp.]|nr:hypothetical protein [Longimicrobium sp.]
TLPAAAPPVPAAPAPTPPPAAPVVDIAPRQAAARPAAYDGPPPMDDIPPPEFDGYMPAQDEGQPYAAPARERFVASPAPAPVAPQVVRPEAATAVSSDGPLDGRALNDAWKSVMADASAIPGALRMILRSVSRVSAEGGQARVELPSAQLIPDVSSAGSKRAVEEALGKRLGRKVSVHYVAGQAPAGGPAGTRITNESARRDRLQRMMEGEPVLAAAVQAWDLELVD